MKVLMINSVCGIRSTGRICTDIADVLNAGGHVCKIAYGREQVPEKYKDISVQIGTTADVMLHGVKSIAFDRHGFGSKSTTKKLLKWIDAYQPDIIHLHNIHGYYLNIELLFRYIKEKDIPVIWTLHDCWAFTGHCSHFTAAGCEKWKEMCHDCVLRGAYPASLLVDNSRKNYVRKKEFFCGVKNMKIVTPSDWLGSCVKQSFLSEYSILTIQNGIDLSVFRPTDSDFSKEHNLEYKKIVLGVASAWTEHKGLHDFYKLADLLDKDYQVVLVGLTPEQIERLPENVLGIPRTNSAQELAQIYSAAYVHISMSCEETMGLTIIEANACGTPVIVYNATALPEIVTQETGVVLDEHTPEAVAKTINVTDFSKERYAANCIAHAQNYEKSKMYAHYIALYRSMTE